MATEEAILKNRPDQKWEKMLPDLGKDSPVFTILRVDPQTIATTLMIDSPATRHPPPRHSPPRHSAATPSSRHAGPLVSRADAK
jgi:hypothetical protein